ncbi:MAG: DUF2066 domain-containing protein [Halioglobus sp.]
MSVRAAVVSDLYEASVPVTQRSDAALSEAARRAMSQVFVKVSGSEAVLSYPEVSAAVKKARSYVQQYAYVADDSGLLARFEFDAGVVSGIVTEAGAPLWTANRPEVLLWLVVDTAQGRRFITADNDPEQVALLREAFNKRGVPVRLPLYDLADSAALSPDQAWSQSSDALRAASARYGVNEILGGRAAPLSTGNWVGDWTYLTETYRLDRSITASDDTTFIRDGVAIVAEDMASRYAVAAKRSQSSGGVMMVVDGVRSYGDYAGIVSWLEGLELIKHANVEQIRGEQIELRLIAQADADQLSSIIELNDRLVPVPQVTNPDRLTYQWRN